MHGNLVSEHGLRESPVEGLGVWVGEGDESTGVVEIQTGVLDDAPGLLRLVGERDALGVRVELELHLKSLPPLPSFSSPDWIPIQPYDRNSLYFCCKKAARTADV